MIAVDQTLIGSVRGSIHMPIFNSELEKEDSNS